MELVIVDYFHNPLFGFGPTLFFLLLCDRADDRDDRVMVEDSDDLLELSSCEAFMDRGYQLENEHQS